MLVCELTVPREPFLRIQRFTCKIIFCDSAFWIWNQHFGMHAIIREHYKFQISFASLRWNQTCDEHMHLRVGTPGKIHMCLRHRTATQTQRERIRSSRRPPPARGRRPLHRASEVRHGGGEERASTLRPIRKLRIWIWEGLTEADSRFQGVEFLGPRGISQTFRVNKS